jgi:hypothetical protein
MVGVRKESVAQEKAFRGEMQGIERHKERQAAEERFSVAFGGALGLGNETLFLGWKVLQGDSGTPEYS